MALVESSAIFICPGCKRTASISELRHSLYCPYCNLEMKEIVCVD